MRLDEATALARLREHDHAVLATLHPERGVDTVPVVYAVDDAGYVGVPIDRVKPKASVQLQREANLDADPRASLMAQCWDRDDWARLWWVRVELRWEGSEHERADVLADLLALRYPQYRDKPFARVLVFRIDSISGWSASAP
jgi:putative heme iron utilization protein